MSKLFLRGALLAAALHFLCVPIVAQNLRAEVTVNLGKSGKIIPPAVFGNNFIGYQKGALTNMIADYYNAGAGVWNPEKNEPSADMIRLAREAGITVARYPGGTVVHKFDWKKTIGPVSGRPEQKFGIPEFLRFCDSAALTPMITLADYRSSPKDAAELLEYLNAPDDGKNQWAAQRAADGRREPWSVLLFEYGNENDLDVAPALYARKYEEFRTVLKKADARVQLGFAGPTGFPDLADWLFPALKALSAPPDFVVHHCYLPDYQREDGIPSADELFTAALASGAYLREYYAKINKLTAGIFGKSVPLAVTEYNGLFVQEKPVPYRFTLGNALINAVMLFEFANPANNVRYANSWHFANEYWGAVRGYTHKGEQLRLRPLFHVLRLLSAAAGAVYLPVTVASPELATPAAYGIPETGAWSKLTALPKAAAAKTTDWQLSAGKDVSHETKNGELKITFGGSDVNYYHAVKRFLRAEGTRCRVSASIRTENLNGGGVCIEALDARGWNATRYAVRSRTIAGDTTWQRVFLDFVPLQDTKEIILRARRFGGHGIISGTAYVKDILAEEYPNTLPHAPLLSSFAAKGKDTLCIFLLNRGLRDSINTQVTLLKSRYTNARAEILCGDSVTAHNEGATDGVRVAVISLQLQKGKTSLLLPPHSLAVLRCY